jgi:hypothetical protein
MTARRECQELLVENAFESGIAAQALVNDKGQVLRFSQKARDMLGIVSENVGQNLSDMSFYFKPVELQPLIRWAYSQSRYFSVENILLQLPTGQTM